MRVGLIVVALSVAACGSSNKPFVCDSDRECIKGGVSGRCIATTGTRYCAFPSSACPSGLVFDSTAGSVAGECAPDEPPDMTMIPPTDLAGADFTLPPDLAPPPPDIMTTPNDAGANCTIDRWCTYSVPAGPTVTDEIRVAVVSDTDAWGVRPGGGIIRFNGSSWSTVQSPTTKPLNAVFALNANDVWAVGEAGTVIHWTGSQWNTVTSGTTQKLTAVWASSASDVWAVGWSGTIIHWTGSSFAPVGGVGSSTDLFGVAGSGPSDVWAVGSLGSIFRYTGSGSFSSSTSNTTASLRGVWALSATDVWAVGSNGTVLRRTNTTWSPITSGTSVLLNAVWGTGSTLFVVGYGGTVLRWNVALSQFVPVSAGSTTITFLSVNGSSPTNVWLGGAYSAVGYVMHYEP
jgi:hypothetical protein